MKFSIITVCFNSAAVLPACMKSLADQTFSDYEWVVVDGASKDGTVELARRFSAAPLQLLSEPDQGIYDAMNKAIGLAQGDYLYFLNSDDSLADRTVLHNAARALDAAPATDLLVGQVLFVGADGSRVRRSYTHLRPHNILFDSLCHQAVFARRSLFNRLGRFDTSYRMAADFHWLARALRAGHCVTHTTAVVACFHTGGAHAREHELSFAELMRVRQELTTPLELKLTHALTWTRHKLRRLFGLPAWGRHAVPEEASRAFDARRP